MSSKQNTKIETKSQREEKVRDLVRKLSNHCIAFYERASQEQKQTLWGLLEQFEQAILRFREREEAWDSQLIDVTIKIGDRKVKSQEFSTWDSVMDKAREVLAYVGTN